MYLAGLHVTGAAIATGSAVISVTTTNITEPIILATLGGEHGVKQALLDAEFFPEDEFAEFQVTGDATVSLSGTAATYGELRVRIAHIS